MRWLANLSLKLKILSGFVLVLLILADSLRVWFGILRGSRDAKVLEAPFVMSQLRVEEL